MSGVPGRPTEVSAEKKTMLRTFTEAEYGQEFTRTIPPSILITSVG